MQTNGPIDALPLWALFICGLEGLSGTRRSLAIIAVAIAFSVVIELIADLDRPQEGVLRVS
jgi:hypothetical protein